MTLQLVLIGGYRRLNSLSFFPLGVLGVMAVKNICGSRCERASVLPVQPLTGTALSAKSALIGVNRRLDFECSPPKKRLTSYSSAVKSLEIGFGIW